MQQKANDRTTYMADLEKCLTKLEQEGYTDQYIVENGRLRCLASGHEFSPENMKAVNFYRFEGASNPDDTSILYAIETNDGRKGTIVDAYGLYADEKTGQFMQGVEMHKKIHNTQIY